MDDRKDLREYGDTNIANLPPVFYDSHSVDSATSSAMMVQEVCAIVAIDPT